jgi:thiol-disulfide isomerase/thioredoxin
MRLIALFLFALSAASAQSLRKAPSFTLPDIKQNFYDLTDYRGKVVVLELMQTGCPHCAAFSKVLEQVKTQYGNRVQVFSVVNPPESIQDIQKYITNQ